MNRLPSRLICFVAITAILTACSPPADRLTFSPQAGEIREYQIIGSSQVEARTAFGNQSEYIENQMVVQYHARTAREIELLPTYMNLKTRSGDFSSADEADSYDHGLREWMEGGFTLTLNRDGSTQSFSANRDFPALYGDMNAPDPAVDFVQNELTQPGTLAGLPLREGASMTINLEQDDMPPVEVEVLGLTDDDVTIALSAIGDEISLYGRMIFERDSGWLVRAAFISEQTLEDEPGGMSAKVRSRTSMMPANVPYMADYDFLAEAYEQQALTHEDLSELLSDGDDMAEPFAQRSGRLEFYNGLYELTYRHSGVSLFSPLMVNARDVQAYTVDGEALDLALSISGAYPFYMDASDDLQSAIHMYPLGWFGVSEQRARLGYIEVTLDAYIYQLEVLQVPLDQVPLTMHHDDASLRLEAGSEPGHYILYLSPGPDTDYGYILGGVEHAVMRFSEAENVPDWLDDGERRLLAAAENGNMPTEFEFIFPDADEVPDSVHLLLHRVSEQPLASQQVRFYDPAKVLDAPHVPLPQVFYLYPDADQHWEDDLVFFADERPRIKFEPAETTAMAPTDGDTPQLFWTLTPEQVASCTLNVNDERFVWREWSDSRQPRRIDGQLSPMVIFQLQGANTERHYFYNETIEVSADCAASTEWQVIEKPASMDEYPWLVPVSVLEGVDKQTRIVDVLRQYRFVDADGRALAVMPPSSEPRSVLFAEQRLADALIDDTWLRIGGDVARIEVLQQDEERIQHHYQHQFPSLPDLHGEDSE